MFMTAHEQAAISCHPVLGVVLLNLCLRSSAEREKEKEGKRGKEERRRTSERHKQGENERQRARHREASLVMWSRCPSRLNPSSSVARASSLLSFSSLLSSSLLSFSTYFRPNQHVSAAGARKDTETHILTGTHTRRYLCFSSLLASCTFSSLLLALATLLVTPFTRQNIARARPFYTHKLHCGLLYPLSITSDRLLSLSLCLSLCACVTLHHSMSEQ